MASPEGLIAAQRKLSPAVSTWLWWQQQQQQQMTM
jgi:hypothetical protein